MRLAQMDREFEGARVRAEWLTQRAQQAGQQGGARVERGDGWQSYSREHAWEDQSQGRRALPSTATASALLISLVDSCRLWNGRRYAHWGDVNKPIHKTCPPQDLHSYRMAEGSSRPC